MEFVIYPFSFKEYMECKRLAGNNASIQEEFEIYILMGRMPLFQITQLSQTLRGRGNRTRAALQGCSNPSSWTKPTSRKSSKSSTPQSSWCKYACANSTFPLINMMPSVFPWKADWNRAFNVINRPRCR